MPLPLGHFWLFFFSKLLHMRSLLICQRFSSMVFNEVFLLFGEIQNPRRTFVVVLYGSWIYNYLCNQFLSPPTRCEFESQSGDTTLCDQVCQRLTTGRWLSPFSPVSSINKTDRHDITEILLKVALNTITLTHIIYYWKIIQYYI